VFFRGQQASAFLACGATDGIFYWRLFANKKWLGWAEVRAGRGRRSCALSDWKFLAGWLLAF
jgi:hypothetical protein